MDYKQTNENLLCVRRKDQGNITEIGPRALHLQWEHLLGSVSEEMEPVLESFGQELSWGC